jgi:hypothetical protein
MVKCRNEFAIIHIKLKSIAQAAERDVTCKQQGALASLSGLPAYKA